MYSTIGSLIFPNSFWLDFVYPSQGVCRHVGTPVLLLLHHRVHLRGGELEDLLQVTHEAVHVPDGEEEAQVKVVTLCKRTNFLTSSRLSSGLSACHSSTSAHETASRSSSWACSSSGPTGRQPVGGFCFTSLIKSYWTCTQLTPSGSIILNSHPSPVHTILSVCFLSVRSSRRNCQS